MTNGGADFLVIGGGVIGLAIARELKRRDPSVSVILIEKEPALGRHASGRNTGVLHAGFYYTADSLKARFCRDGNRALTEFCEQHGLAIAVRGVHGAASVGAGSRARRLGGGGGRDREKDRHDRPRLHARSRQTRARTSPARNQPTV